MAIRISQHGIEVARSKDSPIVRVSQVAVETLRLPTAPLRRVSQVAVEVLRLELVANFVRVSQVVVETLRVAPTGSRFAQVTQVGFNTARNQDLSQGLVTQVSYQAARNQNFLPTGALKSWMVFDPDGQIDILMISGTPLTAVNELAVLNGANIIALGQEIFQFRDVTDLGNNLFRLSHLLRGRFGTEQHMNSHVENELAIFLDSSTIRKTQGDLLDWNTVRLWKAVGAGQSVVDASAKSFTDTGIVLKPWAPVDIRGTRDGGDNLTIDWTRRTRINIEWLDSVDVGLGEEIYEFQVEILDGAGAVVRTIAVVDTDTTVYLETEQTTDFGSAQSSVLARVSQKSESFGFGYSNTELI